MTLINGFAIGAIAGLVLRLGIVRASIDMAYLIIALGLLVTVVRVIQRRAMINPTSDGIIMGFCWLYGMLNLFEVPTLV